MLQPKKVKYRKMQKDKTATHGVEHRGTTIAFGSFGLKAMEGLWITDKQLEAARVAVTRYMKREGQVWIRVFPDKPRTSKPAEVRMGKGKGAPWCVRAVFFSKPTACRWLPRKKRCALPLRNFRWLASSWCVRITPSNNYKD